MPRTLQVTLLVPWLAKCEQKIVYPEGVTFETSAEQAKWVKEWVEKRTEFPAAFDIKFYPGVAPAAHVWLQKKFQCKEPWTAKMKLS